MNYRRSTAWELMGFRLRPAGNFVRSGHRFPRRAVEGMAQGLGLVECQQVGSGSTIPPQNLPDRRRGLIGLGAPLDCQSDQRLIDADGQWPNPAVVLSGTRRAGHPAGRATVPTPSNPKVWGLSSGG
jgi:hypothetical protein